MRNITLDKNYNLFEIEKEGAYEDDLLETIDLIERARNKKIVTNEQASLLLSLVIKKEIKKETRSIFAARSPKETHSLFLNLKTKQIKHA